MREKIKQQQDIALEVLHKLEITDPNCILAGGAPREWWFEKEANDLDFYVYWGECTTCGEDKRRLDLLGFKSYRLMNRNPMTELYGSIPELRRVWEIEYKGEKVQIMVMSSPTFRCVIDRFGCSVSKVWWKGNSIKVTLDFIISHILKVNLIKEDYNAGETYVKKMSSRYPSYRTVTYNNFKHLKSKFEDVTKSPYWVISNLGGNQNYEMVKELFKNPYEYKDLKNLKINVDCPLIKVDNENQRRGYASSTNLPLLRGNAENAK